MPSFDATVPLLVGPPSSAELRRQPTLTEPLEVAAGTSPPAAFPPLTRPATSDLRVGERYELRHPLASGGMATVYLGRMVTPAGFARTVAIKRLHPHVASDPVFVAMFFDEARLAMRIQHPNVVTTFDVAQVGGELLLVMDYVHGESLVSLMRRAHERRQPIPPAILSSIMGGVLTGLHAAHEARSESGEPLGIVHRDVSPQNVIVGIDGVPRVLDFGVAKAVGRMQTTETGQVKGKLAYMAPEQMTASDVDRRADLFAAAVLLWEGLANERLFDGDGPAQIVGNVLSKAIRPPSGNAALDEVVLKGLSRNPQGRFATAREMAIALEEACPPATARAVEAWLWSASGDTLHARTALLSGVESGASEPRVILGRAGADGPIVFERRGNGVDTLGATDTSPNVPSSRRGRDRRLATGAAIAILAAPLLLFGWTHGAGTQTQLAPVGAAAARPAAASASAWASPGVADAEGTGSADAASTSSAFPGIAIAPSTTGASAEGAAIIPLPGSAPRPHAAAGTTHYAGRSRPVKKPDCTSPFTVTADGIRMPRQECF